MKFWGTFLLSIGGLKTFIAMAMSLFCIEKSEYTKFANKLYRWIFIIGIILASIGAILLSLA